MVTLAANAVGKSKSFKIPTGLKYFLIALPFMIFTFMFAYIPLFGWIIAFSNYKTGMRITDIDIIGFTHFMKLTRQSNELLRVLRNTLAMSGLNLLTSPLPIVFAILLNELRSKKFKKMVQTITILPNFISWIVVFGVAFSFFSSSGLVNTLLGQLGLPQSSTGLLGDKDNTWFFQLGINIWKNMGWSSIIYLAAITGIDTTLYEAAKIDGANKWQCILHITLPGIIPTFFVLLILAISNILNNGFDQYFMFYNSMVANNIEVLDYYIYKVGILIKDMPYSVVIGMTKSLISIFLLFFANLASKRVRGQSIF